jgi:hypothetical protein
MPPPGIQLSGDAAASAHAAAAARLEAHRARVDAATKPVELSTAAAASGGGQRQQGVCFGDVLLVARGGGGGSNDDPLLFLSADPLSGVSAGVWAWPEVAGAAAAEEQLPPPRALPAAATLGGTDQDKIQGTASKALRVLPAAKGQSLGDPLRFGDRFALAIEDPASVFFAATGGGATAAGAAKTTQPLLLLTSRCPVAALCPSARAGGGAGGGGGGSNSGTQAVAFVEWSPSSLSPTSALLPPSDAAWVALPTDLEQRVLREGEPVEVGAPVLLCHAPTRRPLWWEKSNDAGGPAPAVVARWATTATRTRAGSPSKRAHGVDLGPVALPANVWRFLD